MRRLTSLLISLWLIVLSGCVAIPEPHENPLLARTKTYFDIYAEREDFSAFMGFYAAQAEFKDMGYGSYLQGKEAIADFLDWDRGDVTLLENTTLVVDEHVVQGRTVITRGYFNRFVYQGQEMGPWYFVIWLEFDQNGRILKQTDWINYTPKAQFTGGENMNRFIPKRSSSH